MLRKSTVILVSSPQGGSGKSTIAVNLAFHYAKQNLRVLLMDLAVYGSLPSMLKIPIRGNGMSSLITALEQKEEEFELTEFTGLFHDAILHHESMNNLHMLLSASPLKMEKLTANQTDYLLRSAKSENYDLIIVDTSSELSERNITAVDHADLILIPTLQDVTSGWKVLLYKEILDNLNVTKDRIGLVINRCSKYSAFNNSEFQLELGCDVLGEIEELSKWVHRYVNVGIPMVNARKKRAASPFQYLANTVMKRLEAGYER